jgi:plasmid stabilization system protein ParE
MRIKLSAEAAGEMVDAAAWYDARKPGLENEFIAACDRAFIHLAENPALHLHVGKGFYRYLMPRFPYVVFYEAQGDLLIVAGVIHGARNPSLWRQRLGLD